MVKIQTSNMKASYLSQKNFQSIRGTDPREVLDVYKKRHDVLVGDSGVCLLVLVLPVYLLA